MRSVRYLFISALIAAFPTALLAQVTNQQPSNDQKGFWKKNAATDWKTPVHETSSTDIVYRDYPLTVDEVKLRIQREAEEAVKSAETALDASKNEAAATTDPQQPRTPLTREEIIAKYGSPDKPLPIRAQKDSPPEMQALFEALNSGDKELAWQYSLALAERNNRIKSVVSKATDYQLLAMEAMGQRPPSDIDPESDEFGASRLELRELMEKTKAERAQQKVDIDQHLSSAGADRWATAKEGTTPKVAPAIPVDPAGKVKLLIFFDEKDLKVRDFAKSLKSLQERLKSDPNVSIFGLTMRSYTLPALKKLGAVTSFPFPLVNGEALGPELRIQRYPTFVFLAVTSKQTYQLEGARSTEEIEKVVNVMKGTTK